MIIRTELNTSRALKDGTYPVTILFQHSNKQNRIKTGLTCKKGAAYWKNGKFTSKVNDYKNKNKILENILLQYNTRKQQIEDADQEVTFELLTNNEPLIKRDSHNFVSIVKEKGSELSYSQKIFYDNVSELLRNKYGDFINVNEIDQKWFDSFRKLIDVEKGTHNRMKNRILGAVGASLEFAVKMDYIEYHKVKEIRRFNAPINTHKLNITDKEFSAVMNAYKKDVVAGGNPKLTKDQEEAFALFMLCMAFQGLNPLDIAKLKIKDLKFETIVKYDVNIEKYNNITTYKNKIDKKQMTREVVKVKTSRSKNGNPVFITSDKESMLHILEFFMKGKSENDYLVNCLQNGKDYDRDKIDDMKELGKRRKSYFESKSQIISKYMVKFFEREKLTEKFGNWDRKLSYQQFRHKFANMMRDRNYVTDDIRKYMGHIGKPQQVLEKHYFEETPDWIQAEGIYMIFNNGETIKSLMAWRDMVRENLSEE